MIALAAALAACIGVVFGLLGGGGSVLLVPVLVYALGVDARLAMTMSLLVVGATSAVGALVHARAGRVRIAIGVPFGAVGMVGAFTGGRIAKHLPPELLMTLFGVFALTASIAMLRPQTPRPRREMSPLAGTAIGGSAGFVAGLIGAGGGFVIVPALVLVGGLAVEQAVGTSLLVIAMQCAAGFLGRLGSAGDLDARLTFIIAAACTAGVLAGAHLAARVPATATRRAFGILIAAMGLFVVAKQLLP